jgi:hypothetical protein
MSISKINLYSVSGFLVHKKNYGIHQEIEGDKTSLKSLLINILKCPWGYNHSFIFVLSKNYARK